MNNIQERQSIDLLNRATLEETNFQRADLSEVSSSQAPLTETTPNEVTVPNAQFSLIPVYLIAISWIVSLVMRLNFRKSFGDNLDTIKHLHQIPCSSCRFFKNDPYLKCAVHPLKVSSTEAINCSDYWALDSNKFHQ